MRAVLCLLVICLTGCAHMSLTKALKILRNEQEDSVVKGHMNRRQGEKTNKEIYWDESLAAKLERHKWHLPKDLLIAVLLWVLNHLVKKRKLKEQIDKHINGNNKEKKGDS